MKKKTIITLIFYVEIIGVFLLGCTLFNVTSVYTPLPEQVDKSPFTGVPCAAPCWYGLEVGVSTESDVISTLPTLTFVDQKTIRMNRKPSVPDYFIEEYGPGVKIVGNCVNVKKTCLEITVSNNLLQQIILSLNYEIMQEEAIKYLGNPDYVGYGRLSYERVMCEVYFVWVKSHLILASRFEDLEQAEKYCYVVGDEGKAPSNLLILEARYLSEAELNDYLSSISSEFFEFTGTGPGK